MALVLSVKNGQGLNKQKRLQIKINKRLQEDNRALSKSAVGMGQKVLETERRLNSVLKKQYAILNTKSAHPSYDQANRLIQMGASENDLVSSCGFSHGEAEVLLSLNKVGMH
jgi:ankyrin repeat protein